MTKLHPLIDRAITHIREQGEPAYSNGECQLLTTQGLQCAVGGLINPRDITPDMESAAVPNDHNAHFLRKAIGKNNPGLDLPVDDPDDPLWEDLAIVQDAHDQASTPPRGSTFMQHFERVLRVKGIIQ